MISMKYASIDPRL